MLQIGSFSWGEDDDEQPDYSDEMSSGDEAKAVASSDPDDALDDDEG